MLRFSSIPDMMFVISAQMFSALISFVFCLNLSFYDSDDGCLFIDSEPSDERGCSYSVADGFCQEIPVTGRQPSRPCDYA